MDISDPTLVDHLDQAMAKARTVAPQASEAYAMREPRAPTGTLCEPIWRNASLADLERIALALADLFLAGALDTPCGRDAR